MKAKNPTVPPARADTTRRAIVTALGAAESPLTARALSGIVHLPEKDVVTHLEHVRKSLARGERKLSIIPALCRACGYEFEDRERLGRPGRCPTCHGERIDAPRFTLDGPADEA